MESFSLILSDDDFRDFSRLVHRKAGINLHEGKKELVRARLARRIRDGGFGDFGTYYQYVVEDKSGDELIRLLDSVSTNLTSFFRESRHFDFLTQKLLPDLSSRAKKTGRARLRAWSAGCSTGEEPYTIAITVMEAAPELAGADFKVLATDLSTRVLRTAHLGVYSSDRIEGIPLPLLRRYFQKGRGDWADHYRVKPMVRRVCVFRRLNLNEPFPLRRTFDFIFCRNVMIYFDKQTQAALVNRFSEVLEPGGYLFIGHAESLSGVTRGFKYVQPTIYRKS